VCRVRNWLSCSLSWYGSCPRDESMMLLPCRGNWCKFWDFTQQLLFRLWSSELCCYHVKRVTSLSQFFTLHTSAMKMEAASSSDTLILAYKTTRCHRPENHYLNSHHHENLKTSNVALVFHSMNSLLSIVCRYSLVIGSLYLILQVTGPSCQVKWRFLSHFSR
jgi:hypothetical protein